MKSVINWNYERGSWQWDIFCLLILAFIFLTPKTWFNSRNTAATQTAVEVVKAWETAAAGQRDAPAVIGVFLGYE